MMPMIVETEFIQGTSGGLKTVSIVEMTFTQKISLAVARFTVMPLVMFPVGLVTAGLGYGESRYKIVRGLFSREEKVEAKEEETDTASKYRRRSRR